MRKILLCILVYTVLTQGQFTNLVMDKELEVHKINLIMPKDLKVRIDNLTGRKVSSPKPHELNVPK